MKAMEEMEACDLIRNLGLENDTLKGATHA